MFLMSRSMIRPCPSDGLVGSFHLSWMPPSGVMMAVRTFVPPRSTPMTARLTQASVRVQKLRSFLTRRLYYHSDLEMAITFVRFCLKICVVKRLEGLPAGERKEEPVQGDARCRGHPYRLPFPGREDKDGSFKMKDQYHR